jgi:acetyltransferase-like isoleucine patch superfamily enzyme
MLASSERPDRPIQPSLLASRWAVRKLRNGRLRARLGRRYSAGQDTSVGAGAIVLSPDHFSLGDHVRIGRELFVESNLVIGSNVLISSRVAFISDDHRMEDTTVSVFYQGRHMPATTTLEGDNLIGHGCIIIAPVRIGRGAIVGAGSIVTRDLPPYTLCFGSPARPIRARHGRVAGALVE